MTPNGAVFVCLGVIAGALIAGNTTSLAALLVIALVLAFGSRQRVTTALFWSALIVLPLAGFMSLVWVGIVGRAPHEIATGAEGSRAAAASYVALVCLRLFIIALAIQATFLHFAGWTPLRFVGGLRAPPTVKRLLTLTLSLIETMTQAVDRARTALITAGIITRRRSLQNLRNGWLLVQTVWLTAITIVIARTRDKWTIEDTLARLDTAVAGNLRFSTEDLAWIGVAAFGIALAIGMR